MTDAINTRGATISRPLGQPVLKVPSPDYKTTVSSGSSTTVWLSSDKKTGLKVAHIYHVEGCTDDVARKYEAFSSEAHEELDREKEIYRHLGNRHPGILRYLEISAKGIKFPYLENGDLVSLLKNTHHLSPELKCDWIVSILDTYQYLHSKGVLHADIGWHNILVTDEKNLVVCDFSGSAIGAKKELIGPQTRYAKFAPNKDYMDVGIDTEVFALGGLMYEILMGKRPFEDLKDAEVESRVLAKEWECVEDFEFGEIIRGCWEGVFGDVESVLKAVKGELDGGVEGKGDSVVWRTFERGW